MKKLIALLFIILTVASCSNDEILRELDTIRKTGDTRPDEALNMLETIHKQVDRKNEYVQMKCMLLHMRLKDKAYIKALTDDSVKVVTSYFSKNGTEQEQQEAYYYAGCTYRDLKDTPRALENFLKSTEIAEKHTKCDSIMQRDAYSNLAKLFFDVQDYQNSLKMAINEYDISKKIDAQNIKGILHVGESYLMLDSIDKANDYFCEAEKIYSPTSSMSTFALLHDFSSIHNINKAQSIYNAIRSEDMQPTITGEFALAEYFTLTEKQDSTIACYKRIIENATDLTDAYKAARLLHGIYKQRGDIPNSQKYADAFIAYSESLDFGKRQEETATVNNRFQYYKNRKEVQRITQENDTYRSRITWLTVGLILVILTFTLYHLHKKNRYLSEILSATQSLKAMKAERKRMQREIKTIEEELADNERQLLAKIDENRRFLSILHKAELTENAADVIQAIKDAASGKHTMTADEWQKFYRAVDDLRPDLMEKIIQHLGRFTEQQQQVCYLLSIGLSNAQIENLTDIPHVTVWRWVKKFDWVGDVR